jgi:hypothetical protein
MTGRAPNERIELDGRSAAGLKRGRRAGGTWSPGAWAVGL